MPSQGCTMTLEYLSSQLLEGRSKSGSHYKKKNDDTWSFLKMSEKRDENTVRTKHRSVTKRKNIERVYMDIAPNPNVFMTSFPLMFSARS